MWTIFTFYFGPEISLYPDSCVGRGIDTTAWDTPRRKFTRGASSPEEQVHPRSKFTRGASSREEQVHARSKFITELRSLLQSLGSYVLQSRKSAGHMSQLKPAAAKSDAARGNDEPTPINQQTKLGEARAAEPAPSKLDNQHNTQAMPVRTRTTAAAVPQGQHTCTESRAQSLQ